MKKIRQILTSSLLVSFLLISCNDNSTPNIEKEQLVGELLKEYALNLENKTKLSSFLNRENIQFKSSSNNSKNYEKEVEILMNSFSTEFLDLYKKVSKLNLTEEEFKEIAKNYEYLLIKKNNKEIAKKVMTAIIPNDKACANSVRLSYLTPSTYLLGLIGQWVHC